MFDLSCCAVRCHAIIDSGGLPPLIAMLVVRRDWIRTGDVRALCPLRAIILLPPSPFPLLPLALPPSPPRPSPFSPSSLVLLSQPEVVRSPPASADTARRRAHLNGRCRRTQCDRQDGGERPYGCGRHHSRAGHPSNRGAPCVRHGHDHLPLRRRHPHAAGWSAGSARPNHPQITP